MASESRKLLHSSPTVKIVNEQSEVNIGPNLPPSSVETDPRGGGFCLPFSQEIEDAILHLERPENTDEWSSTIRKLGVAKFLHHAAATGKVEVLRIVLRDPTCNVNARDEQGRTALSLACSGSADSVGKAETVKLLLQNSADVLISYSGDYTCLHMAAFWGHTKVVEALLDGNNDNASWKNCKRLIHRRTSDDEFTALHMAATGNHDQGEPIARAILRALRTAEVNGQGLPVDPKEHFHIEDREWLEFLLQVRNLLHLEGGEISLEVISRNLLAYGKRGVGRILKNLLGEKFYEGLVQTYVDLVSYTNARDRIGRTALHYAAWENKAYFVAFLMWDSIEPQVLGYVANVNIVDIRGFTALHLASKKGHKNVVNELVRTTSPPFPKKLGLKLQYLERDLERRKYRLRSELEEWEEEYKKVDLSPMGKHLLQENYVQPNVQANSTGQSELQLGTNENNRSAPSWGPKAENSVWLEDRSGVTALHYAVEEEHEGVVRLLVRHPRTDLFVCARDGLSPWTIAFSLSCNHRIQRLLRGWQERGEGEDTRKHLNLHQQKLLKQAIWLATAAEKGSNSQETVRNLSLVEEQIFRTFAESLMDDLTYCEGFHRKTHRFVYELPSGLMGFGGYINLLHVAAYYGFERQFQALLNFNRYKIHLNDLEVLTSTGQSPLHFAVLGGPEVVAVLLGEKTLNISQPNREGKSPTQFLKDERLRSPESPRLRELIPQSTQCFAILTTHPTLIENYYRDRQVYVDAVNAILVGAALIASVTFAGFLQPPLGHVTYFTYFFPDPAPPSTPESLAAVGQYPSVAVFWVFNSLSFFSAIATVLVGAGAVLPSSSGDSLEEEVSRVRSWLRATAASLAISILCILGVFTAAGSASLPNTAKYQTNITVTATIGVTLCLVMFFSFCYRLSIRIRRSVHDIRDGPVHDILGWFVWILWKLGIVDHTTYICALFVLHGKFVLFLELETCKFQGN